MFRIILHAVSYKQREVHLQITDLYVIRSPHFPLPYPNNVNYSWIFISNDEGYFVIKPGRMTHLMEIYDYLKFGVGTIISQEVVYQYPRFLHLAPHRVFIRESKMWVMFSSDHFGTRHGFYITIERNPQKGKMFMRHFKGRLQNSNAGSVRF